MTTKELIELDINLCDDLAFFQSPEFDAAGTAELVFSLAETD